MREALLLVFLIIITILILIFANNTVDGFIDIEQMQKDFVDRQLSQWGDVGISLISAKKVGTLGDSADKMLQTPGEKGSYPLRTVKDGLWKVIDKCEAVKTMDCSAFDKPDFSKDCGVCLDIGVNSDRVPATGGLVLLEDDKKVAREGVQSNFLPDYVATIGFCPAGKLVSTKEECLKLQRQLLCNKNSSYDQPGCSQCYSDTSYSIVDPKTSPGVISDHGEIFLLGEGQLVISEAGRRDKTGIHLNMSTPYKYTVRGAEGSRIKFRLTPPANSDEDNPTVANMCGILSSDTATGTFAADLRRIVLVDEVTGRKPRSRGKSTIKGTPVSRMAPGHGQDSAIIVAIIPFSFAETTTMESTLCKDAPFVTTQAAAEFLESDPCYKKGSGPGKFSLECLQTLWEDNSCTGTGTGYPANTVKAAALMTGEDGSFLSLNDIADFIYNKALITSTGIDQDGKKLKIQDWSAASVFCTGREITSPCDTEKKNSGPLSPECIIHLWNNQSSKKNWQGRDDPIGPTYYNSNSVSLFKEGPTLRSCQATGTLSPIDPDGKNKRDIIRYWQRQGGVNNVKRVMADLHRAANAQRVADDQLSPYFKQCYGDIQMAPRPITKFSIQNNMLPETYAIKQNTVLVQSLKMTQDYKLQFVITPRGIQGNWGNIIHLTSDDRDHSSFGSRTPAIWFWPGNLQLHVRIGASSDLNWGIDIPGCQLNKESMFSLECRGKSVRIILDGKSYTATHPNWRYSGNVKVYGSNPWYPPAIAEIKDVGLQLLGNSTPVGPWRVDIGNSNSPDKVVPLPAGIPNTARNFKTVSHGYSDDFVYRIEGSNLIVKRVDHFSGWGAHHAVEISEGVMPHIANIGFVRIEGGSLVLNLSQLVVLDEHGNNISRGRPQQVNSETYGDANKTKANDGGEAPRGHPNEYHGAQNDGKDLWQVQLDGLRKVSSVIVYNRSDCCSDRMASGYVIKLFAPNGSGGWNVVFTSNRLTAALVQVVRTR